MEEGSKILSSNLTKNRTQIEELTQKLDEAINQKVQLQKTNEQFQKNFFEFFYRKYV